jgi:hypothetical protein
MISTRFLPIVCALVGLALVPTFIHSYSDYTVSDGRLTRTIPASLAGYEGSLSRRNATNATWGKWRFDSDDWIERVYKIGRDNVTLTVVRSYDPKSLYHHPELAVAYGPSYLRTDVRRFPQRLDIPVHLAYTDVDGGTVAMYVLHYDGRFIEDPIAFQLRTAGELLFSGRKPMTLFFVADASVPAAAKVDDLPSARLLFAAIDQFLGTRGPAH